MSGPIFVKRDGPTLTLIQCVGKGEKMDLDVSADGRRIVIADK